MEQPMKKTIVRFWYCVDVNDRNICIFALCYHADWHSIPKDILLEHFLRSLEDMVLLAVEKTCWKEHLTLIGRRLKNEDWSRDLIMDWWRDFRKHRILDLENKAFFAFLFKSCWVGKVFRFIDIISFEVIIKTEFGWIRYGTIDKGTSINYVISLSGGGGHTKTWPRTQKVINL